MLKAVIFDCFGVIRPDRFIAAYREKGGDPDADRELIERAIRAANLGLIPNSRQVFAERLGIGAEEWLHALDHGVGVDMQLLDYIEELRKTYKTAVLSNASRGRLKEIIGAKDAERCFDVIVESGSLGFAKPDPEIYEYAADQLGVRFGECLFTDDKEEYCEAARAVGMKAITYQSFEQFKIELEKLLQGDEDA
jgi:HAD superfamily hydrolase (TIGR01509 family)